MPRWNPTMLVGAAVFCAHMTSFSFATPAEDANKIATQLKSVATRLDQLASFEELGAEIPFTTLTASDALRLGDVFGESLFAAMDAVAGTLADHAALESAINTAGSGGPFGGVTVTFSNASVSPNGTDPTKIDVSFDVQASRTLAEPIVFFHAGSGVKLSGGGISITVTLNTSLAFQLDTSESNLDLAFALLTLPNPLVTGDPRVDVSVAASGAIMGFPGLVGIADVSVTGTAALDQDISITFSDPDGTGLLTMDELTSTSYADLVVVVYEEDAAITEVDIVLNLDSTLITGSPDGTVSLFDDDLTGGLDAPTVVALGDLEDFTRVSPSQIIAGFSSLAACLGGIELFSDVELPFLQARFADSFDFAEPVAAFIRQQVDAAIICGSIDDDPPRGEVANLTTGDIFFCQATTLDEPAEVEWRDGSNTLVLSSRTDLNTIGTAPSSNARLQMTADEKPDVVLRFKNDLADPFRNVSRLFLSAEELLKKLALLGGFNKTIATPAYDQTTKSLTYHLTLVTPVNPPPVAPVGLDFADQLKRDTNLAGLFATGAGSAAVDARGVTLDLTFGIILVADLADITPADLSPPVDLDRFFIKVRTGTDEPELTADADISATVNLKGRIGILAVDAVGNAAANTHNNSVAFEIVPLDPAKPMLTVDLIPPSGTVAVSGTPGIADAILLTELPAQAATIVSPARNIKMTGGLLVTAEGTSLAAATGNVAIHWEPETMDSPTITPDADFLNKLMVFDTDPSHFGTHDGGDDASFLTDSAQGFPALRGAVGRTLRNLTDGSSCLVTDTGPTVTGTHTGGDDETSLTDSATDFTTLAGSGALGRTLNNIDDGSSCVVISVVGLNTLECTLSAGAEDKWDTNDAYELLAPGTNSLECSLGGGTENLWDDGDEYELIGKPADLRSVIADSFGTIMEGMDAMTGAVTGSPLTNVGAALDTKLPLIGVSPEDRLSYLEDLSSALDRIRVGEPLPMIVCVLPSPPTGQDPENLVGLADITIKCKAVADDAATTGVHWTIVALATGTPTDASSGFDDLNTVGPDPSARATFIIPSGNRQTLGEDFKIEVEYDTATSGQHKGVLPQEPLTLQSLERALENDLGIPDAAFVMELTNLPTPGTGADAVQDLVIRLGFNECTRGASKVTCDPNLDRLVDQSDVRIVLDLSNHPDFEAGMAGIAPITADFTMEHAARVQIDLAIPLASPFDASTVMVENGNSTIAVELAAETTTTSTVIAVNIGPLEVELTGEARMGAKFMLAETTGATTSLIADYVDNLGAATIGGLGGPVNCGTIIKPKILTGTHTGTGSADAGLEDNADAEVNDDARIGATVRKLGTVDECTVTDRHNDQLMCLLPGSILKECDTSGSACTTTADCPEGETCVEVDCTATTDCATDEVCVEGDCFMPEFTWAMNDQYELIDDDDGMTVPLTGDVCANFSLLVPGTPTDTPAGKLGFKAADIAAPDDLIDSPDWFLHVSRDTKGLVPLLSNSVLDVSLLFKAVELFITQNLAILEDGSPGLDLPVVGERLDGGVGLSGLLDDGTGTFIGALPTLEMALAALDGNATFGEIKTIIKTGTGSNGLFDVLNDVLLLGDTDGLGSVGPEDVIVTGICGGGRVPTPRTSAPSTTSTLRFS